MNELNHRPSDGPDDARLRSVEIRRLFQTIRVAVDVMIGAIGTPDAAAPEAIFAKLNDLCVLHVKLCAAEEALNADPDEAVKTDDNDSDKMRADIGGQIDRIRAAISAERVP